MSRKHYCLSACPLQFETLKSQLPMHPHFLLLVVPLSVLGNDEDQDPSASSFSSVFYYCTVKISLRTLPS